MKLDRRMFIGSGLAFSATPALAFSAPRNSAGALKLGVASYSLRKFSRPDAIKILNQLGISYLSIKSFHLPYETPDGGLKSGSQEFRDAGLEILSGGNIDLTKPEELRQMFQYAKTSGIPMMVCAPSHATLDAVEKLVKEFDVKTAIHNHGPEDKHFGTPEIVLEAVKHRDHRMGLCLDIGHTSRAGADFVEWARRAGPRLFDVHVKDLRDPMLRGSDCPVGDGSLPIIALFKTLKEMNYQGGIMLEYEIDADSPLLGMMKSVAYMRGLLDGLAA